MNSFDQKMTRRQTLVALTAGGLASSMNVLANTFPKTPEAVMGPFYPIIRPLDEDADLTHVQGRDGQATGQVIHLMGRVLNRNGMPVEKARIEMWQANSHGRYDHSSDPNVVAPLDPYFQGYAVQFSDSAGRYHFKTIMPGAYPATPEWIRTPHIHFDIRGKNDRLVTQLYFEGQALNASDLLFQQLGDAQENVLVELKPSPTIEFGSLFGEWNIVLNNG